MNKEELITGIQEIGEYFFNLTKVGDDDKETKDNKHIKYFYKVLKEVEIMVSSLPNFEVIKDKKEQENEL